MILAAAVAAIGRCGRDRNVAHVALPVAASAITAASASRAVVMVLLRMVFQPGPNELVDLASASCWR